MAIGKHIIHWRQFNVHQAFIPEQALVIYNNGRHGLHKSSDCRRVVSLLSLTGWADWSFYSILVPLFMCNWSLMVNVHVYRCKLFVLWWHQTPFVCNFISFFRHNVAFNAINGNINPLPYHIQLSTTMENSNSWENIENNIVWVYPIVCECMDLYSA